MLLSGGCLKILGGFVSRSVPRPELEKRHTIDGREGLLDSLGIALRQICDTIGRCKGDLYAAYRTTRHSFIFR